MTNAQEDSRNYSYQKHYHPSPSPEWDDSNEIQVQKSAFWEMFKKQLHNNEEIFEEEIIFSKNQSVFIPQNDDKEELYFDFLSSNHTQQRTVVNDGQMNLNGENNVPQIESKNIHKKSQPKKYEKDKNICRYLILNALRTMENIHYQAQVLSICLKYNVDIDEFKQFYSKARTTFSGYKVLRKHLLIESIDSEITMNRKRAFRDFMIWYVDNVSTSYILNSKSSKTHMRACLEYKNFVLAYYVRFPERWIGNQVPTLWVQSKHR